MTIRDLLDAGVIIEGFVTVKKWIEEDSCYDCFIDNMCIGDIDNKVKDMKITYIYTINGQNNKPCLVMEVE